MKKIENDYSFMFKILASSNVPFFRLTFKKQYNCAYLGIQEQTRFLQKKNLQKLKNTRQIGFISCKPIFLNYAIKYFLWCFGKISPPILCYYFRFFY